MRQQSVPKHIYNCRFLSISYCKTNPIISFILLFRSQFDGLVNVQNERMMVHQRCIIKLMNFGQTVSSFYSNERPSLPMEYIYDDVYGNVAAKTKYSRNPKYTYFNALMRMKQKLGDQTQVYNGVFSQTHRRLTQDPEVRSPRHAAPIYHMQRINRMKFKLYRERGRNQFINRLPVTDLSFQAQLKPDRNSYSSERPRLEEILAQYRRMNNTARGSQNNGKISNYSERQFQNRSTQKAFGRSLSLRK